MILLISCPKLKSYQFEFFNSKQLLLLQKVTKSWAMARYRRTNESVCNNFPLEAIRSKICGFKYFTNANDDQIENVNNKVSMRIKRYLFNILMLFVCINNLTYLYDMYFKRSLHMLEIISVASTLMQIVMVTKLISGDFEKLNKLFSNAQNILQEIDTLQWKYYKKSDLLLNFLIFVMHLICLIAPYGTCIITFFSFFLFPDTKVVSILGIMLGYLAPIPLYVITIRILIKDRLKKLKHISNRFLRNKFRMPHKCRVWHQIAKRTENIDENHKLK